MHKKGSIFFKIIQIINIVVTIYLGVFGFDLQKKISAIQSETSSIQKAENIKQFWLDISAYNGKQMEHLDNLFAATVSYYDACLHFIVFYNNALKKNEKDLDKDTELRAYFSELSSAFEKIQLARKLLISQQDSFISQYKNLGQHLGVKDWEVEIKKSSRANVKLNNYLAPIIDSCYLIVSKIQQHQPIQVNEGKNPFDLINRNVGGKFSYISKAFLMYSSDKETVSSASDDKLYKIESFFMHADADSLNPFSINPYSTAQPNE